MTHLRDAKMYEKLPMAAYRYALALLDAENPEVAAGVLAGGLAHAGAPRPRAILEASLASALVRTGREEDTLHHLRRAVPVLEQMHEDEYLHQAWYHIAQAAKNVDPPLAPEALRSAYTALQSISLHVRRSTTPASSAGSSPTARSPARGCDRHPAPSSGSASGSQP